jgi:hypothetical protein
VFAIGLGGLLRAFFLCQAAVNTSVTAKKNSAWMGSLVLLALMLVAFGQCDATANARQATPGYQLQYPRTNAIGVGAAAAAVGSQVWVVGGSGDTADGAASQQNTLVYGDTRRYDVASRGE